MFANFKHVVTCDLSFGCRFNSSLFDVLTRPFTKLTSSVWMNHKHHAILAVLGQEIGDAGNYKVVAIHPDYSWCRHVHPNHHTVVFGHPDSWLICKCFFHPSGQGGQCSTFCISCFRIEEAEIRRQVFSYLCPSSFVQLLAAGRLVGWFTFKKWLQNVFAD